MHLLRLCLLIDFLSAFLIEFNPAMFSDMHPSGSHLFVCFVPFQFVCISSCFILFYYYALDPCLFSNERQKSHEFGKMWSILEKLGEGKL